MKKGIIVLIMVLFNFIFVVGCTNDKVSDDMINKLLDRISVESVNYYETDKLLVSQMSKEFKVSVANEYANEYYKEQNIINNVYTTLECDNDGDECLTVIFGHEIKKIYENIFGIGTYEAANGIEVCGGLAYFYDEQTGNYRENNSQWGCGTGGPTTYERVVISSDKKEKQLSIVVAQYNYLTKEDANEFDMEYTGELIDYTNNKVVAIIENSNNWKEEINNNLDKLSHYKFTFNKENDNYVFYSVEKIN